MPHPSCGLFRIIPGLRLGEREAGDPDRETELTSGPPGEEETIEAGEEDEEEEEEDGTTRGGGREEGE